MKYLIHIAAIGPVMASVARLTPMIFRPRTKTDSVSILGCNAGRKVVASKMSLIPGDEGLPASGPGERRPTKGGEASPTISAPGWGR